MTPEEAKKEVDSIIQEAESWSADWHELHEREDNLAYRIMQEVACCDDAILVDMAKEYLRAANHDHTRYYA